MVVIRNLYAMRHQRVLTEAERREMPCQALSEVMTSTTIELLASPLLCKLDP